MHNTLHVRCTVAFEHCLQRLFFHRSPNLATPIGQLFFLDLEIKFCPAGSTCLKALCYRHTYALIEHYCMALALIYRRPTCTFCWTNSNFAIFERCIITPILFGKY